jgi:hypothetical protein
MEFVFSESKIGNSCFLFYGLNKSVHVYTALDTETYHAQNVYSNSL